MPQSITFAAFGEIENASTTATADLVTLVNTKDAGIDYFQIVGSVDWEFRDILSGQYIPVGAGQPYNLGRFSDNEQFVTRSSTNGTLRIQALKVVDGLPMGLPSSPAGAGGGGGGGGAATIADGADVAEGATTDAAAPTGNGSVIAILKALRDALSVTTDATNSKQTVGNTRDKFRDGYTSKDATKWVYPTESGGILTRSRIDGNVAGASYLVISLPAVGNPGNEWIAQSVGSYKVPYEVEFGLTLSQRLASQNISVELVGVDGADAVLTDSPATTDTISGTISVTSNVWTINTTTTHNKRPGDYVYISGSSDSRLNISQAIVTSILSPTSYNISSTLANGTYDPVTTATVTQIRLSGDARFGAGYRWYGASAGNCDVWSRNDDPRTRLVALNPGNTQDTAIIPNEGGVNYASLNYVQPFRTKGSWHMEHTSKRLLYRARDIDTLLTDRSTSLRREPIPIADYSYKIRVRAMNLPTYSRPVGQITAAVKTGTNVATLTILNHGLTAGSFVTVYGIVDQTNFANLTTATQVTAVVDANNVQVTFGATTTASSYGGFVVLVNGGSIPAIENRAIQTYTKTADGLRLSLVATSNWAEVIGNTVTPYGLVTASAVELTSLVGRYRVAYQSTTTLELEPLDGQDLSAVPGTPTACGGTTIRNTDVRIHYFRMYDRVRLEVDQNSGGVAAEPMPVNITGSSTIAVTLSSTTLSGTGNAVQGNAADSAAAVGNPVLGGGRVRTGVQTDYADGDVANFRMDANGRLIIADAAADALSRWQAKGSAFATTTDTQIQAAQGVGVRSAIDIIRIRNTTAVAGALIIDDAAAELDRIWLPASMTQMVEYQIKGNIRGTANTIMNIKASVAGMSIDYAIYGYKEF
jgi:hypothetical protein